MTTDQATRILAEHHQFDPFNFESDLAIKVAGRHMDAAHRYGQSWEWREAEKAIERAYHALGAEPPSATGHDWHTGRHPIQVAARTAVAEMN
jgi:hypothetical protein